MLCFLDLFQILDCNSLKENRKKTLKETAIELNLLTAEQYDQWVRPENMVGDMS